MISFDVHSSLRMKPCVTKLSLLLGPCVFPLPLANVPGVEPPLFRGNATSLLSVSVFPPTAGFCLGGSPRLRLCPWQPLFGLLLVIISEFPLFSQFCSKLDAGSFPGCLCPSVRLGFCSGRHSPHTREPPGPGDLGGLISLDKQGGSGWLSRTATRMPLGVRGPAAASQDREAGAVLGINVAGHRLVLSLETFQNRSPSATAQVHHAEPGLPSAYRRVPMHLYCPRSNGMKRRNEEMRKCRSESAQAGGTS